MTRLEKYLLATASEIIEAETTVSRYFVIGNVKVRVSDRWSKMTDADLQVIIPYNGGTKYVVTIKDSPGKFLVWNANQIKDFIPSLQLIKGMKTPVQMGPKPKSTWDASQVGCLPEMVRIDLKLKSSASINEDVQIFLTCTSLTYIEFLNIYKIVVVDNNKVPTIKLLQEAYSLIA